MDISNTQFFRALAVTILALLLSAGLLSIVYLASSEAQPAGGATISQGKPLKGNQFKAIMGDAQVRGDTLRLSNGKLREDNYHVLATTRLNPLQAKNYPVIGYELESLGTVLRVNLIWRSGGRLHTRPINRNPGGIAYTNLGDEPSWRGVVTEIGFHILGDIKNTPVDLSGIALLPHGWGTQWKVTWSEWTAFRGWGPSSINALYGTPNITMRPSPTSAIIAWAALAMLLLFIFGRARDESLHLNYAMVLLLSWAALDLLWQRELGRQVDETQARFGGKTTHEKHLAEADAGIYRYISRLNKDILPASSSRIFILHHSQGHNAERLKAQYYLLPHNIYNYRDVHPNSGVREGDYILALGELPRVEYKNGYLISREGSRLRATLKDSDPRGSLYRVENNGHD